MSQERPKPQASQSELPPEIKLPPKNTAQVSRLWHAWRTVQEMLTDRGFEIPEDVPDNFEDFELYKVTAQGAINWGQLHIAAPAMIQESPKSELPTSQTNRRTFNHDGKPIWVEFIPEDKDFRAVRNFIRHLAESYCKQGILVAEKSLSVTANKDLEAVKSSLRIDCFILDELQFNITHHSLVPPHILLSHEEKTAVLKKYKVSANQLPSIKKNDPVARYFGFRVGQLIRIIRREEDTPNPVYRQVVH